MVFELPVYPENQVAMAKYMQSQFQFNGVKAPERHLIERELWQTVKHYPLPELLQLINALYEREPREYQYVAIELALRAVHKWHRSDLEALLPLVTQKAWWDSIDAWRKVFGEYVKYRPEEFRWVNHLFLNADNFWLRRIGITLQLRFREKTDIVYLKRMILADIDTDEFFIQKAIGWALRDFAKTDPDWVIEFVAQNQLTTFAQREALKQIKRVRNVSCETIEIK